MQTCNNLYERLATGALPSRTVYANMPHGVFAVLDPYPAAEGHITVATLACASSIDALESAVLRHKVDTVATYAGRVLTAVFPSAPYPAHLTACNQIAHPHEHCLPGDDPADWAKRFAKLDDWPRLDVPDGQMDELRGRLQAGSLQTDATVAEIWEACDAEIAATGIPDPLTLEAITRLGIKLPHHTDQP